MGYNQWHEMSDRLHLQGKNQTFCKTCERWKWPHESAPCSQFVAGEVSCRVNEVKIRRCSYCEAWNRVRRKECRKCFQRMPAWKRAIRPENDD